ncbi:MAG: DUF1641 domain-containing protein [Sulfobacillus sp.]|nr:DUF1641 domain-containing protein [Sulfobacillus sp.]
MAKAVTTRIPGGQVDKSDDLLDPELLQDVARLVKALKSSGVLPMVTALLEQRDDVLAILMRVVNTPEVKQGIVTFERLAAILASLSPELVAAFNDGLQASGEMAQQPEMPSLTILQLFSALKNPHVSRALRTILAFLERFGRGMHSRDQE